MKDVVNHNYKNFKQGLVLGDYLAIDRTNLAVERTHLAYMRTVVTMVVAAITILRVLGGWEGWVCAIILIIFSIVFYIRGKRVCKEVTMNLKSLEDEDD